MSHLRGGMAMTTELLHATCPIHGVEAATEREQIELAASGVRR